MSRAARRRLALALALAGLAAARGVALSLLVPPFHAPDEPYHFDYAQALAENAALPRPDPACRDAPIFSAEVRAAVTGVVQGVAFHPELPVPAPASMSGPSGRSARATTGCGPASIYPPLWYASAALAYRASEGAPLLRRLLVVRWVSVAWSCAGAVAAFAAGALVLGSAPLAALYALLVVLQPMTAAMDAAANSESAALACAAAAFAALAALHRRVAPRRALVGLAAALTAGVLAKPGFALALPTFAALAALAGRRGTAARRMAAAAAVVALPVAVALGFALSGGERTGLYQEIADGGSLRQQLTRHLLAPRRLFDVWVEQYWGKLGWMDTQPARGWYVALALATLAGAAGLLLVRRHRAREAALAAAAAAGTLAFAAALYAVAWRRGDLLWVQGRHVLVLFPLHAYVLLRGLAALGERWGWRTGPPAALVALVAAHGTALAAAGLHRFYGPDPWPALQAWQRAWGVPLLAPAAAVTGATAVVLLLWAARRRRPLAEPAASLRPGTP